MPLWLLLLILLVLFLFLVLRVGGTTDRPISRRAHPDDLDEDVLAEAEREIEGLDANTPAEEADEHLSDWGPGAPRTPPQ